MTLTFDLETWLGFRVTAHPLPTHALYVGSMSQIGTREDKICSGLVMLERQMDGQPDHYRSPAEWGPNTISLSHL